MIPDRNRNTKRATLIILWGSVFFSFGLPLWSYLSRSILVDRTAPAAALRGLMALLAPRENLFLLVVLNLIPFFALTLFALLHLGQTCSQKDARGRLFGLGISILLMTGCNGSICLDFFLRPTHPTMAPLLLPLAIGGIPPGYLAGRLVANLFR
jgi:hypothetical protein